MEPVKENQKINFAGKEIFLPKSGLSILSYVFFVFSFFFLILFAYYLFLSTNYQDHFIRLFSLSFFIGALCFYIDNNQKDKPVNNKLKELFTAKGRIGRLQFFLSFMTMASILFSLRTLEYFLRLNTFIELLLIVAALIFGQLQVTKRLHDLGKEGSEGFHNIKILFDVFVVEGDEETNKYGENPLKKVD